MPGHEHDDDELDDASLKSMRAVWLSMRDEEPPAAGMSALLAAAREKAEQMRAKPSWWQRVVALLRRPPMLAFATVMILIGGAVLVTRGTKDEQVEALSATEEAREASSNAGPTRDPRAREVEDRSGVDEQAQSTAAPVVVPADPAPEVTAKLGAKEEEPAKDVARPHPKPQRKVTAHAEQVGENEPDRYNRFDGDKPQDGFTAGNGDAVDTTLGSPGRVAPPPRAKPSPTPAPDRAPEKPTEVAEPTGEPVIVSDGGKVSTPPNEQLARQAESAASRGDCGAVRVIVARMKKQDEAFFKARLGKNAAVVKCL